jgi:hypothetical protein
MSAQHLGEMTFFAEYSAIGCGKEKESIQQSAFSVQPKTIYRKGRKERKGTGTQFLNVPMIRAVTARSMGLSDLRILCGNGFD